MKSKSSPGEASSYAYDDDTSDSDDEDLVLFKNKVKHLEPKQKDLQQDDPGGSDADEEDSEEDVEEDGEDEEESDDSSDEDEDQPKNIVSMTDAKKSQLSKIQQQLAAADEDSDDDSDNSDNDNVKTVDGINKVGSEVVPEDESENELESSEQASSDAEEAKHSVKRKVSPVGSEVGDSSKKLKTDVEEQDVQRNRFKAKLSKMSIEEIHRLKNKLGLKLFNQKMSGKSSETKQEDFKRDNKNRPREMSSKKQVGRFREIVVASKIEKRDPRFDPNCGEFDDKLFKENYKFVNEYKSSDLKFLKKQLQEEEDPEQIKKLKYLIQRTENQLRQIEHDRVKDEEKKAEREEKREQLKAGIKPQYISKSKQKERDLMKKYETLKESGGLDKYISKKTKKNLSKDRKRMDKL